MVVRAFRRYGIGLALVALALTAAPADARIEQTCPAYQPGQGPAPPVIVDGGFGFAPRQHTGQRAAYLWLRILPGASDRAGDVRYRLDVAWGTPPAWFSTERQLLRGDAVDYFLWSTEPTDTAEPVVFGLQVTAIDLDGRTSAPSSPFAIHHAGKTAQAATPRADHLLFAILALGLIVLIHAYRREPSRALRVRLAAVAGLASLLFVAATAAMPWLAVDATTDGDGGIECALGEETICAGYIPAGPTDARERRNDLARWTAASRAVRLGEMFALLVLFPALLWVLAAPYTRVTAAAIAVGAGASLFTLWAAAWYEAVTPRWLSAEVYWTSDIAMLAAAAIAAATITVVRLGARRCPPPLARARARHVPARHSSDSSA